MRFDRSDDWHQLATWLTGPSVARPSDDCGLVHCEPGWSWQVRVSDYDLWLVVDGRGSGTIDGTTYDLVPGDLLHVHPGAVGLVEQDPHRRFTIAYCHYDWWDHRTARLTVLPADLQAATHLRLVNPVGVQDRLQNLIRLTQDRRPLAEVERTAQLQMILVDLYRQQGAAAGVRSARVDARIEQVVATLRANPGDRVALTEAARRAEMSPQYFSRTFSAQVGLSYRDFCLANRLDRARMLLVESAMTVGEIAKGLGYADTYLFSRQVAGRFGCSPTRLRAQARGPEDNAP